MKLVKPRIKRKRDKIYYVIETHVDDPVYHVVLNKYEWEKILILYDSFLEVLHYAEKFCFHKLIQLEIDRDYVLSQIKNIEAKLTGKDLENDKLVFLSKYKEALIKELKYIDRIHRDTEKICREIMKWNMNEQYLWARHDELWREIIEKYG